MAQWRCCLFLPSRLRHSRVSPLSLFRVLLLRRLWLPLPLRFSHLPVWPSTRRPWPPPCSVFEGRGAGESRFLCGERCCKGVCRESGARVSLNVFVDTNLDSSRQSVQVDSSSRRCAHLAIDTRLGSSVASPKFSWTPWASAFGGHLLPTWEAGGQRRLARL